DREVVSLLVHQRIRGASRPHELPISTVVSTKDLQAWSSRRDGRNGVPVNDRLDAKVRIVTEWACKRGRRCRSEVGVDANLARWGRDPVRRARHDQAVGYVQSREAVEICRWIRSLP